MRVRVARHPAIVSRIAELEELGILRLPLRPGRSLGLPPRWRVKCSACNRFRVVCGYPKQMVDRAGKGMRCQACAGERRVTTGVLRTHPGNKRRRLRCPACGDRRWVACTMAYARDRHRCRGCGQVQRRRLNPEFVPPDPSPDAPTGG